MDSAKVFNDNSYGKINNLDLENQSPIAPTNNTKSINLLAYFIIISTIISFMVIILQRYGLISTGSISTGSSSYLDSNSYDSIVLICKTARYPDSCFNSISSVYTVPKPDPELILKLSLQVAIAKVSTLSSFIKTANVDSTLAMNDCEHLLNDAVSRLNSSVTVMDVDAGEKMLTDKMIGDIQTWMRAALADQETCMDGLEDMTSSAVTDDVKNKVEISKEYVSNALAILANIRFLLDQFGQTLH